MGATKSFYLNTQTIDIIEQAAKKHMLNSGTKFNKSDFIGEAIANYACVVFKKDNLRLSRVNQL
jgi:hypothetical protein